MVTPDPLYCLQAIEHIESAHKVKCSKRYKEPKMKYKGAEGAPK
jgi:hypothetical protein